MYLFKPNRAKPSSKRSEKAALTLPNFTAIHVRRDKCGNAKHLHFVWLPGHQKPHVVAVGIEFQKDLPAGFHPLRGHRSKKLFTRMAEVLNKVVLAARSFLAHSNKFRQMAIKSR